MTKSLTDVINYCKTINGSKGFNDTKTQFINEITQDYNTARQDVVYRFDVLINSNEAKDIYINDSEIPISGVIDVKKKQSADTKMEESIQVYPNQIKQGDLIKFKINDTDTLRTYLITSNIEKKHGYDEGIFKECNHITKWMTNGKLYSTQSIATNQTKYTTGIKSDEKSGYTEVDYIYNIIMPYNDTTKLIKRNQRIILNNDAWRVTQTDFTSENGLLSLLLGKDSVSENDDLINEIAGAKTHSYAITLSSNSETIVESTTYQISPVVTDKGVELTNANVTYTSNDETIAKVDSNGLVTTIGVGTCNINVSIGEISSILSLSVIAKTITPVTSYTCKWSTSPTSTGCALKRFMSSKCTISETVDGITNSSLVVNFSLDSVGTNLINTKSINITRQSNTEFLVKNVSMNTSNSFVITFTNALDNSVISVQTIQLSGM